MFPGEQRETWTYDDAAGAWYHHRFYDFEPDLNMANPEVRAEVKRIVSFWLQLGVSGFRVDAAPFVIELTEPGNPDPPRDFGFLAEVRQRAQWRRGDSVFLAEANVEPGAIGAYFGDAGGTANRLHMLFNFLLNGSLMLALVEALRFVPRVPDEEVLTAFAPSPDMRLYSRRFPNRGIDSRAGGARVRRTLSDVRPGRSTQLSSLRPDARTIRSSLTVSGPAGRLTDS